MNKFKQVIISLIMIACICIPSLEVSAEKNVIHKKNKDIIDNTVEKNFSGLVENDFKEIKEAYGFATTIELHNDYGVSHNISYLGDYISEGDPLIFQYNYTSSNDKLQSEILFIEEFKMQNNNIVWSDHLYFNIGDYRKDITQYMLNHDMDVNKYNNEYYYFKIGIKDEWDDEYIDYEYVKIKNKRYKPGWKLDENGWKYYIDTGEVAERWLNDNNNWYFMDQNGYAVNDSIWKIYGVNYIFDKDCKMITKEGWIKKYDSWWYVKKDGALLTEWNLIDKKWYYFDGWGEMVTGNITIDNKEYYLNQDGSMYSGWLQNDNKWIYYNTLGAKAKDWNLIDGDWYYFYEDGIMATGNITIDNKEYYLNQDGSMYSGWLQDNNRWVYYNTSGAKAKKWDLIDGYWYYFDSRGVMQTGWLEMDGSRYYLNSAGSMQTGWKLLGNKWYYFNNSGKMLTNTVVDGWTIDGNGVGTPQ